MPRALRLNKCFENLKFEIMTDINLVNKSLSFSCKKCGESLEYTRSICVNMVSLKPHNCVADKILNVETRPEGY